jgi:hypothetical protein
MAHRDFLEHLRRSGRPALHAKIWHPPVSVPMDTRRNRRRAAPAVGVANDTHQESRLTLDTVSQDGRLR